VGTGDEGVGDLADLLGVREPGNEALRRLVGVEAVQLLAERRDVLVGERAGTVELSGLLPVLRAPGPQPAAADDSGTTGEQREPELQGPSSPRARPPGYDRRSERVDDRLAPRVVLLL